MQSKKCKTCNKKLPNFRSLGQLTDYCDIKCSNASIELNIKRCKTSKNTRELRKNTIPERTLFLSLEDLKRILIERSSSKGINISSAKNLALKPEILFFTKFLVNVQWSERIYCIKNDIEEKPACQTCGSSKVSFAQPSVGYHTFCSRECSAASEATKHQRAVTNIEKYGNPVAFRNADVKNKQQQTLISRYAATNSWHLAKRNSISKISQELFWNIWQNSKQHGNAYFGELTGELRVNLNGKCFKPDYAQIDNADKRIIEFDGDYWHSSEKSKLADLARDKIFEEHGWKILRISESDYMTDKLDIIDKCVAFLNRRLD